MDSEKVRRAFYANTSPFYKALFLKKSANQRLYDTNQKGFGILTDSQSGKAVVPIVITFGERMNTAVQRKRKNTEEQKQEPKKKKQKTETDKPKIKLFKD